MHTNQNNQALFSQQKFHSKKFFFNLQKYAVYAFIFSLNFEQLDLFNLKIDYLASKITISILLFIAIFNYKTNFSLKHFTKYTTPLLIYFGILTIISYFNKSTDYSTFVDFPFFLNILIFLILINFSTKKTDILLKGLFVFALSTIILTLLYFFGIAVTETLDGRFALFGINQNLLGLSICISLFTLLSILYENKLQLGRFKYLLIFLFPFMFILMIKTGSRVAFISFIIGLFAFLYLNKSIKKIKKLGIILITLILFIIIWAAFLQNSLILERLSSSIKQGDLSSRDMIWVTIFDIVSNNFLWGVGKTGYAKEVYYLMGGVASPHNVLIEVLCYTGILGLSVFLIFLFRIVRNTFKRIKFTGELLPVVLLIPILGMILSGQIFDTKIVWVIFAYVISSSVDRIQPEELTPNSFG